MTHTPDDETLFSLFILGIHSVVEIIYLVFKFYFSIFTEGPLPAALRTPVTGAEKGLAGAELLVGADLEAGEELRRSRLHLLSGVFSSAGKNLFIGFQVVVASSTSICCFPMRSC